AGLVALPRERPYGIHSRLAQAAAIRIFHPTTALATCPLAMTDGAAAVLHRWGGEAEQEIVARLTSREPATAWTAGQWMTERAGGSDVGRTTTVARPDGAGGDGYRLSGVKWFTSAADSHIALTLAR